MNCLVIGAGPCGSAAAIVFRQLGYEVLVLERGSSDQVGSTRSINLVLSKRGCHLAAKFGFLDELLKNTVKVFGRVVHRPDSETFYKYGIRDECNYSISRSALNKFWQEKALDFGAEIRYKKHLLDFVENQLILEDEIIDSGKYKYILACDGAGSKIRQALELRGYLQSAVEVIEGHLAYQEISFQNKEMKKNALHIFPIQNSIFMALPNCDETWTGTIFMPKKALLAFSRSYFDKTKFGCLRHMESLMDENFVQQMQNNSIGSLRTTRTNTFHVNFQNTTILLLGDAAHAIVPFYGQGVNCAFEDCLELMNILEKSDENILCGEEFTRVRKPACDAIAKLSQNNFYDMSHGVTCENELKLRKLESQLEEHNPDKYRSRYSLVMYSQNPYDAILKSTNEVTSYLRTKVDSNDIRLIDCLEKISEIFRKYNIQLDF